MRSMLSACLSPAFRAHFIAPPAPLPAPSFQAQRAGLCRRAVSRSTVYAEIARSLDSLRATVAAGAVDVPARF